MSSEIERRFLEFSEEAVEFEERAAGRPKLRGYAARYGTFADIGRFRETIQLGAFDKVLGKKYKRFDVPALVNHDQSQLIGRESNGTLVLSSDERGLRFEIDPPDTQLGRDVQTLVRDGYLTGCSFAFTVDDAGQSWSHAEDGQLVRSINEVSGLFDVSIVSTPAYASTSVSLRAIDAAVAMSARPASRQVNRAALAANCLRLRVSIK